MQATNLIAADLTRIKKDKALRITLLIGLGYGLLSIVLFLIIGASGGEEFFGSQKGMLGRLVVSAFFNSDTFVLIAGVAVCIFNGSDFSFNTIRNKIIAGNSRFKIYFSQLLVNLIIFFGFYAVYLIFMTGTCAALFSISNFGDLIVRLFAAIPLYIAMTAIMTFIVMTLKSRTGSIVTNLLILMLLPGILSFALMTIDSELAIKILETNPYSMLSKLLGADMMSMLGEMGGMGGQTIESGTVIKSLIVAVCYGGLFTGLGAWRFTKADIK